MNNFNSQGDRSFSRAENDGNRSQYTNTNFDKNLPLSDDDTVSEEELEILAKNVYERLEQEWDNRSERHYGFMIDTPPWSNLPRRKNSAAVGTYISSETSDTQSLEVDTETAVSRIENQLDLLAGEIYYMLILKGERERERLGGQAYYWHHQHHW